MARQWQSEGGSFIYEETAREHQDEGGGFINADAPVEIARSAQIPGGPFANDSDDRYAQIPGWQYLNKTSVISAPTFKTYWAANSTQIVGA